MTKEQLKKMSKDDVLEFIREIRTTKRFFRKDKKLSFEMSGYELTKGECTRYNQTILNKFAFLGIYDYTDYLFLDFYKGCGTLWLKYFQDEETYDNDSGEFGGWSTSEIIYRIFELTIFSNKGIRRRF